MMEGAYCHKITCHRFHWAARYYRKVISLTRKLRLEGLDITARVKRLIMLLKTGPIGGRKFGYLQKMLYLCTHKSPNQTRRKKAPQRDAARPI